MPMIPKSRRFITVDYEQALEQRIILQEILPPEHLTRFVVDVIAQLDLIGFYAQYGMRRGRPTRRKSCWACCSAVRTTDGCTQVGQHQPFDRLRAGSGRDEDPRRGDAHPLHCELSMCKNLDLVRPVYQDVIG